jgi:SDR family mycofactocin-dependent oxidoreductase
MGRLEGKTAVVTGGARGQGRSHAVAFAAEGADVVVCDIDGQIESVPYPLSGAEDLEETARLVRDQGRRSIAMTADVRDPAQVNAVVDAALSEFGRVDILAANAGVWASAQLSEMTDELWRDVMETNLYGVFHAIRAVSRPMIEQASGRIIATGSTAARAGMPNMGPYVASKWGVLGLVKTAALELGQYGITVNAVCPGAVESGMTTTDALYRLFLPEAEQPSRAEAEQIIRTSMHALPVGWMSPEEITNVVVFLASDEARYISGTGIDVCAGQSATWSS